MRAAALTSVRVATETFTGTSTSVGTSTAVMGWPEMDDATWQIQAQDELLAHASATSSDDADGDAVVLTPPSLAQLKKEPGDSPFRKANRARLLGALTESAAVTLSFYYLELQPGVSGWLKDYIHANPIPRVGACMHACMRPAVGLGWDDETVQHVRLHAGETRARSSPWACMGAAWHMAASQARTPQRPPRLHAPRARRWLEVVYGPGSPPTPAPQLVRGALLPPTPL